MRHFVLSVIWFSRQTDRRTVVTATLCGWHHGFVVNLQNEKGVTEIKPECGTVQKSLHSVGLQHYKCVGTHQLTAPDGSAFNDSARTGNTKVAPMATVECLPSKLPSWAATDVSGSCTTLAHAQMQSAINPHAHTHAHNSDTTHRESLHHRVVV